MTELSRAPARSGDPTLEAGPSSGSDTTRVDASAVPPRILAAVARKHRNRSLAIHALVLLLTTVFAGYQADAYANRTLRAQSQISVDVHADPLDAEHAHTAVVFFDGFGSYDSDHLADTLAPGLKHVLDGESWSVSYGNAPLASQEIGEAVVGLARERNKRELDLVGYSMGGIIALEAAAEITSHPDLTVRSITLVSTPDGLDGLRPHQRAELDFAESFAQLPSAQYSTALRFIGEVYFMRDRYTSGPPGERAIEFVKAMGQARQNISGPKTPGTWLLIDQAFATASADLSRELQRVAENVGTGRPMPSILYLGTGAPGRDYMVDDDTSSKRLCGYAARHGIYCFARQVPGAIHTRPEYTVDAYEKTLADAAEIVHANIDRAALIHRLRIAAELTGNSAPQESPAVPGSPEAASGYALRGDPSSPFTSFEAGGILGTYSASRW